MSRNLSSASQIRNKSSQNPISPASDTLTTKIANLENQLNLMEAERDILK